jgi:hypothetical protein
VRVDGRYAPALDEAAADRRRRLQRHLLRGDRRHERLERVVLERRPEAREGRDQPGERLVSGRPVRESAEVERAAEEPQQLSFDPGVVRQRDEQDEKRA